MPRDGSGVYHTPVGTDGVPDTTIESSKYNTNVHDVETDLNTPRPVVAGGTGGTTADAALNNLSAEKARQTVGDFNSAVLVAGSFSAVAAATNSPVAGHAFSGLVYGADANNLVVEARDATDGSMWVRRMTAGVWGAWVQDITTGTIDTAITSKAVRYDAAQTLTAPQQLQGRSNIVALGGVSANTVLFTASGTYTPTANLIFAIVECVGSGGGGGSVAAQTASNQASGGGGGSGGYSRSKLTAAQIGASQAVTIAAAGNGGAAGSNNGQNGGDASLGTLVIAKGGGGGKFAAVAVLGRGGVGGVAGTGDFTVPGTAGVSGFGSSIGTFVAETGQGASSMFGGGGQAANTATSPTTGPAATGFGSGGGGGYVFAAAAAAGGAGSKGIVIVTEYISAP